MSSSSNQPMEVACEGSGTSIPNIMHWKGWRTYSNEYFPHASGSEVENQQCIRAS